MPSSVLSVSLCTPSMSPCERCKAHGEGAPEVLGFDTNWTFPVAGVGSRDEERLVRDLFRGYNKLIRPVENMTQKVEVAFGLAFIQLINVVSSSSSLFLSSSLSSSPSWTELIFAVCTCQGGFQPAHKLFKIEERKQARKLDGCEW